MYNGSLGLFLETSAQIHRLLGSSEMRRGINELCDAFPRVATSQFVLDEFRAVVGGLYEAIMGAISGVGSPHRPRVFFELWNEVVEMLPFYVPGGAKLLSQISAGLGSRYGEREVTPIEVLNFLSGQRLALLELVSVVKGVDLRKSGAVIDKSSCCAWGGKKDLCAGAPSQDCKLVQICLSSRSDFFASAETLLNLSREESRWLKLNLEGLRALSDIELLWSVGKNPGPLGDLIIFWEIPDGWTILTRDRTFKYLSYAHRRSVLVYHVRLPRLLSGRRCAVGIAGDNTWVEATLRNWTGRDVCFVAASPLAKASAKILISVEELGGIREGRVTRVETTESGVVHGVKLIPRAKNEVR